NVCFPRLQNHRCLDRTTVLWRRSRQWYQRQGGKRGRHAAVCQSQANQGRVLPTDGVPVPQQQVREAVLAY
ncbi:hypothetical protein CH063_04593, partial [Colletotrichum higginsianum]